VIVRVDLPVFPDFRQAIPTLLGDPMFLFHAGGNRCHSSSPKELPPPHLRQIRALLHIPG
jgi:hypothetical protein